MPTLGPLVSVIITCYNQESFIGQAIESVLNQTYQNWECWVIDDGSVDASPAICSTYAAKDNRINFLRQQNAGVSSARNEGFAKSTGRYVQFLDGDDWILPPKLEQQVSFMEANSQYGVCYTDHQHYWQKTETFAHYQFEKLNEFPLEQFLFGYDRGVSIPIHTALLRKSIWSKEELPFPTDYVYRYEDWVFWICVAKRNVRFYYLSQNMAIYRMHSSNFITSPEEKAFNSIQAMMYISQVIPIVSKERFLSTRLQFVLSEFTKHREVSSGKNLQIHHLVMQSKNVWRNIKGLWRKSIKQKQ